MNYNSNTWDKCLALMPNSLLARELLAEYERLEHLYWMRVLYWCLALVMNKRFGPKLRNARMRIIETEVSIRQLGGRVPPFWSIA